MELHLPIAEARATFTVIGVFIAISLIIIISFSTHKVFAQDVTFHEYNNRNLGIFLDLPSKWNVSVSDSGIQFISPLENSNDTFRESFRLKIANVGNNVTIDQIGNETKQMLLSNKTIIRITGPNSTWFADSPAYEFTYMNKPGANEPFLLTKNIFTIKEKRLYSILLMAEYRKSGIFNPVFQKVVESFGAYPNLLFQNLETSIDVKFKHGVLEYDTKINSEFGGPASSQVNLIDSTKGITFQLSIYPNGSSYAPNSYLISQTSKGKNQFIQHTFDRSIVTGKWYSVTLLFNSTAVKFYFDGDLITILNTTVANYTKVKLVAESSAVSYKNIRTIDGDQLNSLLDPSHLKLWKGSVGEIVFSDGENKNTVSLFPVKESYATPLSAEPYVTDTKRRLAVTTVVEGLKSPTSMAFLAPDDFLILEKDRGTVQRVTNGVISKNPLLTVKVGNEVERGLLGIASLRDNASDKIYVFLYFSQKENGKVINRLYRYELLNNELVSPRKLLELPVTAYPVHNGGVVKIGPDKNVYLIVGDYASHETQFTNETLAQNNRNGLLPNGTGGLLRVSPDGAIPQGIIGKTPPLSFYYAYGIRNSFGFTFDPVTGNVWDTENGPDFGDEVNLVKPGFNSGWSKVQGLVSNSTDFNRGDLVDFNGTGTYRDPEFEWYDPVAVTGITFLDSSKLGKALQNDLFVADGNYGRIYHFKLNNERSSLLLKGPLEDKLAENNTLSVRDIVFAEGFGVITDLEVGPDGNLYVVSLSSGKVFKIVPDGTH